MCGCVNVHTNSTFSGQCERRKKEKSRKEETEAAKGERRRWRKERRKKIREKVADSIGGNEFKMAARDSVPG